jgi:hypothetical protein
MSQCVKLLILLFILFVIKNISQISNGHNLRKVIIETPDDKKPFGPPTKELFTSSNKNVRQLNNLLSLQNIKNEKQTYTIKPIPSIDFYADDDNETFYYLRKIKKNKY